MISKPALCGFFSSSTLGQVDLEAAEAAGIKLGADVDARSLGDAVDQLKLIDGSADDEKDRHPERRMRAAHMAFEDREMYARIIILSCGSWMNEFKKFGASLLMI